MSWKEFVRHARLFLELGPDILVLNFLFVESAVSRQEVEAQRASPAQHRTTLSCGRVLGPLVGLNRGYDGVVGGGQIVKITQEAIRRIRHGKQGFENRRGRGA